MQVKTYRDVILEYRVHPEPKSLDADGRVCDPSSRGLLRRRPVELGSLVYIGKESNALEQVGQGLVHSRKDVQPIYVPPHHAAWDLIYLPAIGRILLKRLIAVTRVGSRLVHYWRKGQPRPSPRLERQLQAEAAQWATGAIRRKNMTPEDRVVAERVLAAASTQAPVKRVPARRRSRRPAP